MLKVTRLEMRTEGSTPEEDEIVWRHFAYLKDLTEQGSMILVGRTQTADESPFGLAILEADNEVTARAMMTNDPAVADGVMMASLYPCQVALMRVT